MMRTNYLRISVLVAAALAASVMILMQPAQAAFPGKNGKIAFVREAGREGSFNVDIFTMKPDGTRLTNITASSTGFTGSPVWSPDGKKIAFHGGLKSSFDICVMKADGSGLRRITRSPDNDFSPSWSPDSKKIAFSRDGRTNAEIFVMDAIDGSGKQNLTRTPRAREIDPSWSPDGKKIAFSRSTSSSDDVYVMNADGGKRRNLTAGAAAGFSPVFSPDGKKIAFASSRVGNSHIFVMNTDGTMVKRLTTGPTFNSDNFDPDWQPLSSSPTGAGAVSGISAENLIRDLRRNLGLDILEERIRTSVDKTLATMEG